VDLSPLRLLDIEGWMEPEELQWLANVSHGKARVVEIGAFMGRSTCAFLAALGDRGQLTVVDTFDARGTVRHAEFSGPQVDKPSLFERFLTNVRIRGLHTPHIIRTDSGDPASGGEVSDDTVDLLFIDGSHDEASVRRDLAVWTPKVYPGGIICGHDYHPTWPSVVAAVDGWAKETGRKIESGFCGSLWMTTR
jgi:predicted O-methyltransferase YrrM